MFKLSYRKIAITPRKSLGKPIDETENKKSQLTLTRTASLKKRLNTIFAWHCQCQSKKIFVPAKKISRQQTNPTSGSNWRQGDSKLDTFLFLLSAILFHLHKLTMSHVCVWQIMLVQHSALQDFQAFLTHLHSTQNWNKNSRVRIH